MMTKSPNNKLIPSRRWQRGTCRYSATACKFSHMRIYADKQISKNAILPQPTWLNLDSQDGQRTGRPPMMPAPNASPPPQRGAPMFTKPAVLPLAESSRWLQGSG